MREASLSGALTSLQSRQRTDGAALTTNLLYHHGNEQFPVRGVVWCGVRSLRATKTNKLADTPSLHKKRLQPKSAQPSALATFIPPQPSSCCCRSSSSSSMGASAIAAAHTSPTRFGNRDEGGEESLICCSYFVSETGEGVTSSSERSVSTAGQSEIDGVNVDQQENCGHVNVCSVSCKYELKAGLRSCKEDGEDGRPKHPLSES